MAELQQQAAQLTLAVDEYGGLAGIVTLGDLIEQLIGEIQDEYDVAASPAQSHSEAEFDGLASPAAVSARTGASLPSLRHPRRARGDAARLDAWRSATAWTSRGSGSPSSLSPGGGERVDVTPVGAG